MLRGEAVCEQEFASVVAPFFLVVHFRRLPPIEPPSSRPCPDTWNPADRVLSSLTRLEDNQADAGAQTVEMSSHDSKMRGDGASHPS